jgi:hypothetical protein
MSYQKVFGDLEDYSHELAASKARQAFFRTTTEQEAIQGIRTVQLEDGTKTEEKANGIKFTSVITLTALGQLNPEGDMKAQGASVNPVKPDTQLVFTSHLAQKECFSAADKAEFDAEVEANWKQVINEVKKVWAGAFFEGVISIVN